MKGPRNILVNEYTRETLVVEQVGFIVAAKENTRLGELWGVSVIGC